MERWFKGTFLLVLVALLAVACGPADQVEGSSSEELSLGVYVSKATNINNGGYIGDWEHEWGYVLGYMGPGARIYAHTVRANSVYGLITNSHYGAWDHGHHCGWVSLTHLKGAGLHSHVADICPPPDNDFSLANHSGGPTGFRKGSWVECNGCVQRAVVLPTCSDFAVYANYDPVTHTFHDPDGVEVAGRGTIDGKGAYSVSGVQVTQGYIGFGTRFVTSDNVAVEIKDTKRLCDVKGGCTAFGFMHADCIGGELVGSPAGKGPGTPPVSSQTVMLLGDRLNAGQSLTSADGTHSLAMQTDGNLVLYHGPTAIWSTSTAGTDADTLVFQLDGNLVLRGSADEAIWAAHTNGRGASILEVHNNGNVVVYAGTQALWETGTAGL